MVGCCSVTPPQPMPTLASVKWGLLTGTWFLHNRCPCSDGGCKFPLFPKRDWQGWIGELRASTPNQQNPNANIFFLVNIYGGDTGQYKLNVSNNTDCGFTTAWAIGGSCNGSGLRNFTLAPQGSNCCGGWDGESSSNFLDITDSEPSLPPWEPPPEPECDKWCKDLCDPNCCPFGSPSFDPETDPNCCSTCGSGACSSVKPGGHYCGGSECSKPVSMAPIRYSSGSIVMRVNDLETSGLGFPLGHTRSFANRLTVSTNPGNGHNWFVRQWPQLQRFSIPGQSDPRIAVTGDATAILWFKEATGDVYTADFGDKSTLTLDRTAGLFRLKTVCGNATEFDIASGQALKMTTGTGHTIEFVEWAAEGTRPVKLQQSGVVDGVTITEQMVYAWSQPYDLRLDSVTLRRKEGAGAWQDVKRVTYSYYGHGNPHGAEADLRTATTESWDGSA